MNNTIDALNVAQDIIESLGLKVDNTRLAVVAFKLGELSGRIEQSTREYFEEDQGQCVDIARNNLRSDIMQRIGAAHCVDGNVWLHGHKVFWPGASAHEVAYQMRCATYDAVAGRPPLVPLDQVPPAVVIPPGDTSMISFTRT